MIKVSKPKIRFKKFNDSWSIKKLSDTQTCFKDGNYGEAYPKETDLTTSTQGIPFLRGSDLDNGKLTLTNARYITKSKHNELVSGHLIEDDIVIAVRGSLGSLGYVSPESVGWNINSQLAIIRTRKIEIIGNYLIQFLLSNRGGKEISSHITGTALKQLPIKQLKNIKVPIPKIDEQSAIGSLFRTLDDLLASYKVNLANYQSLKATMLSKMFPKAGQTVPEIRLDGFEGEWGNAIINDYVTLLNGRAFKQDELLNGGKYRVVRVGNFNTNEKWYYSNLELEENKYANKDDLLYLWATNFGPEIWKEEKIIFHYHIWKLEFDRSIIDRNYLYYWLEKDKKRIQQNTNGSTMVHVTKSMMENREFLFPMFREQQAIGSYFSNLDNLINSHQEKISQLETLKKKLLQDMFL
ncbi:restriction endonuclease subunit S [Streptococcus sanguinis]|uniref:Type I restriction modification DNA specificity domain protein n=1 Tax=Streptococcus sanguinis SK405 TaxID=888817 RepID=A0ABC9PAV1_STRSA|nr:restriction endonuclease subunit S [Streptococcus sanguinis]EGC23939.1 type I restriction modification DNA specificity domain protein [Streptococcus sanguinis SK405]